MAAVRILFEEFGMAALIFALSSDVIAEEVGIVKEGINPLFVLGMSWLMGETRETREVEPDCERCASCDDGVWSYFASYGTCLF